METVKAIIAAGDVLLCQKRVAVSAHTPALLLKILHCIGAKDLVRTIMFVLNHFFAEAADMGVGFEDAWQANIANYVINRRELVGYQRLGNGQTQARGEIGEPKFAHQVLDQFGIGQEKAEILRKNLAIA